MRGNDIMIKKLLLLAAALWLGGPAADAGTLIYRTRDNQERTVSKVTIVSIDSKLVTIKINSGTETIPISSLVKYYDTDIKSGGEFEDSSAEYSIRLGTEKCPKTGYETTKGRKTPSVFSINYDTMRKPGQNQKAAIREPYLYLFVLTSGANGERNFYSYSSSSKGKVSMRDAYDEAKMLEKVSSLDRPLIHKDDRNQLGRPNQRGGLGGTEIADFKLDGIKSQRIIAWYLVAWGKNKIEATKEWRDTGYNLHKTWWVR